MLKLVKRPKSPFWIARGTINGRRIEVSTGETQRGKAKHHIPGIIAKHSTSEIGENGLTFQQAVAVYLQQNPDARFVEPASRYFDNTPVKEITNAAMRIAANSIYPGRSSATIRRQLYTPVKAIINCAAQDDLCAAPAIKSPSDGPKRTVFMLPDQADNLITEISTESNGFLPALLTFLIGQGSRMKETLVLDGTDISLDHRIATLRDTKNGEQRTVTLIPRVVAALSTLPTVGVPGPLFRDLNGLPFRTGKAHGGQISKPFRRAVVRAELDPKKITPHVCRHTWATWFFNQTKDVLRLKHEGGWKSGEWERYTKIVSPEIGADALRRGWDFSEKQVELPEIGGQQGEISVRC